MSTERVSERPLVSIIVPSYNQGRFIRATLRSILDQDYRPIEIIVVDGASTDETLDVLAEFDAAPELSWVSEPDKGVVDAVNKGISRAKGVFAGIQSSDDYYLAGAIATAVEVLENEPGLGFVFGDVAKVSADGAELGRTDLLPFSIENMLALRTWIPQPATFFKLGLARELGGWRESVPYAADTDLWYRMAFVTGARKIDRLMAGRTMHDAQRDRQGARIVRDYERMIDELEALSRAPRALRRAAAAGCLRIRHRYAAGAGYWSRWWNLLRTVWLHPPIAHDIDRMALLPGWGPLRTMLSRAVPGRG